MEMRKQYQKVCLCFCFSCTCLYIHLLYVYITNLFTVPAASSADIQKIREAIKNATSLQEVERLNRILQSGLISEEMTSQNGNGLIKHIFISVISFILIIILQLIKNTKWIHHKKRKQNHFNL